jgi:hypothetical protein
MTNLWTENVLLFELPTMMGGIIDMDAYRKSLGIPGVILWTYFSLVLILFPWDHFFLFLILFCVTLLAMNNVEFQKQTPVASKSQSSHFIVEVVSDN